MAVTEEARHQLYNRLDQVLGHEEATTLMDHLPQGGWANLATKQDIEASRTATKADMENLRVAMKADTRAEITTAVAGLRSETETKNTNLRFEMEKRFTAVDTAIAGVREEIRALGHLLQIDLHKVIWRYSMTFLGVLAAGAAAFGTLFAALN